MDRLWSDKKRLVILFTVFLYLSSAYNIAFSQEKKYVKLKAGTPILLEFLDTVDSERYKQGQSVPIIVSRSVEVDDYIVIPANSEVYAKVSEVKKAGGWGGKGIIKVTVESCQAIDGQEVLISAVQYSEGSTSRGTATAVGVGTGLICLPFALTGFAVKGEEGVIPAGTKIKARVDTDYKIAVISQDKVDMKLKELQEKYKELKKKLEEQRKKEEQEKKKEMEQQGEY